MPRVVRMDAMMSNSYSVLLERIRRRQALVGVIGLGYVGLPLARGFTDAGFRVLGFDIDADRVACLQRGASYIGHLPANTIHTMRERGFEATDRFERLDEPDAILICVPTPLTEAREPDLSCITAATEAIAQRLRPGQLVVLESTTYPGTTRDVVLPLLRASGSQPGIDFFLAYSPEREDPGNPDHSAPRIPKVVGGLDGPSLDLALVLYEPVVVKVVPVSTPEVAEACKILENTYRAVNIALVNELKVLYHRMGIDIWEVIDAAKTKPFGFQPFYPGPGMGGHCLAGKETVRVRGPSLDTVVPFTDLFERFCSRMQTDRLGSTEVIHCSDLETLSIDPSTGTAHWKNVSQLFRRHYRGTMIDICLTGNRSMRVTEGHPMLVIEDNRLVVRRARDLRPGDHLPQFSGLGTVTEESGQDPTIDLLSTLPGTLIDKLRIRLIARPWREFARLLKQAFGWEIRDSIRCDALAARRFLEIERSLLVPRAGTVLLSGTGSGHSQLPTILPVTPDFCRLLGYYLSEGCITEERGCPRIRFTFHRDEKAYIEDVQSILEHLGVGTSLHQSRIFKTTTIRAASIVLGHLFRDVLNTGTHSYTMRIPAILMGARRQHQEQLLAGLLRGDGDVFVEIGKRSYRKGKRCYVHQNNTGEVGYFSSSPELLAQVDNLLLGLDLHASYKKQKPALRLTSPESLSRLSKLISGDKGQRLQRLAAARVRAVSSRGVCHWRGGAAISVVSVTSVKVEEFVYSLEVPGTHTFATTGGIFVHNCIPIDPFYLSWIARKHGLSTRFIELAGEINTSMPAYIISRVMDALHVRGKALSGSRITLLGMAYKKDIDDPRESPGLALLELLRQRGAVVYYNDPHIPRLSSLHRDPALNMISQPLTPQFLQAQDCVVIVTDHSAYDWEFIVEQAPLIVDTRNATSHVTRHCDRIVRA